jgi:uncharacterized protein YaaW (UPF0174 family)
VHLQQQIRDEAEMMATRACFSLCTSVFWVAVAVLAVARIQGANYSVFIIFIPLFIVVCGVPTLALHRISLPQSQADMQ